MYTVPYTDGKLAWSCMQIIVHEVVGISFSKGVSNMVSEKLSIE